MLRFLTLGMVSSLLWGCSSFSESEIVMRTNPEKRKPKHEYMTSEEKSIETNLNQETPIKIAPQVGIRIPLGK
jgi:hypothetical protein